MKPVKIFLSEVEGWSLKTSRDYKKWFWIGVLIRILIMPFVIHPDGPHIFAFATPFIDKNVWDIYLYEHLYFHGQDFSNYYDPLAYYLFGFWSWVTGSIVGQDYYLWIYKAWDQIGYWTPQVLFHLPGSEKIFQTIFIWKSLYLFADLLILFLVYKIQGGQKDDGLKFIKFWTFNPILLYSVYCFGQFDILPTALICAALALGTQRKWLKWTALVLALSVPFKLFSLILLPFPILLAGPDLKERLKVFSYSVLPLLAIYVPLALHSEGEVFWRFTSGLVWGKSQSSLWPIAQVFSNILKASVYLFLLAHANLASGISKPQNLLSVYFFIAILILLTPPNVPHFLVWVTPFMGLFLIRNPQLVGLYYVAIALVLIATVSASQTFIGMLSPLHPEFFMSFPGWMDITFRFFPSGIHVSLSLLAATVIFYWMVFVELHNLLKEAPGNKLFGFFRKGTGHNYEK